MHIELSELERRTLVGALEAYRRIKGAESKLTSQKEKNAEDMARVEERYRILLDCVTGLQKRLVGSES